MPKSKEDKPKGVKGNKDNPVGKPPINDPTDAESIQVKIDAYESVGYSVFDINKKNEGSYAKKEYRSEKELEIDLCNNIKDFCASMLSDEYISHSIQYPITGMYMQRRGKNALTADIVITCQNSKYILELKNPKYSSENRSAIGQILNYSRFFPKECKMVIVSTMIDIDTVKTITEYKLPIRYIYYGKTEWGVYVGEK